MAVTQKVTLYNNKFTVPPVINAVQNDTDRQVEAYFGDFTLQVGMTGKLSFIRSDGTHYEVSATLNTGANTATAELDQALTQAGVTQAQLKITDSGNVGSTFTFMIKVQPDVAGISVPQDGWSAQEFDQRLTDAENAIDAVEEDVADLQDKEYDYAPVITDTASGTIASFPDGADGYPLKECVVDVDAVQDLHGYDNPWPAGGGKNKLDILSITPGKSENGITFTVNTDGTVKANGTATSQCQIVWAIPQATAQSFAGMLITSGLSSEQGSLFLEKSTSPYTRYVSNGVISDAIATVDSPVNLIWRINQGTSLTNVVMKPMIRLATESDATFAPYSNECPISGWSEAKVTRTGKNLLDDSVRKFNSSNIWFNDGASQISKATLTLPAGTYTYSVVTADGTPTNLYATVFGTNTAVSGFPAYGAFSKTFTLTEPTAICFYVYKSGYTSTSDIVSAQIEIGSTASDYEPYNGQTFTIDLGDTRYGAVLDVTRGKLRINRMKIDDFSALHATGSQNRNGLWGYYVTGIANLNKEINTRSISDRLIYKRDFNYGAIPYFFPYSNNRIYIYLNTANGTLEEGREMLNGGIIVYELATPIEVDLTPTEITTLLGTNNVWADTGDIEVTYACDTKRYIQKVISALA